MTTIYNRSLSVDFSGSLNQRQFHEEVDADGGISPNLIGVTVTGDNVDITFDAALSAGEITTLDGIISAHTPVTIPYYDNIVPIVLRSQKHNSTTYIRLATYVYEGSDSVGPIQSIYALSYKDSGLTNYILRVEDRTNGLTIAENTFANNSEDANQLTPISNIPTDQAVLEFQGKQTGESGNEGFYVDSFTINI